ncbi:Solute carrier family 35 member F6 [Gracilariopsis chorda]|uniref:Solute carrier family 35 member F6 n=1 Tax=Gracilariopsis chorda TaxID=448386 RepID=A0A2V3J319_9FLOR|nr:Solute carrier family 35 member F6 [Gracilariopsis chorda]|eukprot:PXF48387.1 Solute carrier family 35 member F6 [Gracilariopsis chorda]
MKFSTSTSVLGMIFFGTMCSLLAKLIYSVHAPSVYGGRDYYEKPWLQVLAMFVGMSVCVVLDLLKKPRPTARALHSGETNPLLRPQHPSPSVWIISIPTLFDLFATACGTTGLLYTSVSVYQMLRGAMLVWTALLSIIFLRRRLSALNYGGIFFCVLGIALVGMANVWAEGSPASRSQTLFGIAIILVGQILQAAQTVMEEFLLQDLRMSSLRVVAWEGVFGILHCVIWVFPIVYFLPGGDHGHLEDVVDAFYMLTHSWAVAGIIFTDMTMMLFYNLFGMEVTDSLSAVHRVVIETLRTLAVWIVDLLIYYVFSGGRLGEAWNKYSWLQLFGFSLLVFGTILYNFENLKADYEKRRKKATEAVKGVPDTKLVTQYEAVEALAEKRHISIPMVIDEEEEFEEEEEIVGSFYGQTVGSVAHSPFLVAGTTPTSFSSSLRHRSSSIGRN